MRVNIGPYRDWLGPYQLADKIPFISEDTKDRIGEWLSRTWLENVCQWNYRRRKERNVYVHIDEYDTWNADHTLALIILPLLKKLKEQKYGSPYVDDEDVPDHMRHTSKKSVDDWETDDHWVHYKWEWVLSEMIWAFENVVDDSWEDKFRHGEPKYEQKVVGGVPEDDETGSTFYTMEQTNPDYWVDYEGIKRYNERIQNGLRLFGKYYRGLWT